jgi:hypothetical protein
LVKALCRLLAVFGVVAAVAVVAMVQNDAPSTDASKHWCDGVNRDDRFE